MERETTLSLREALKPEHFEFELSKDKKRVTIFLPTESAVAKALTIKKIGETEVQAEEFKPRCQGVIRGIPKEITKEEIKSDLESESNANVHQCYKRLRIKEVGVLPTNAPAKAVSLTPISSRLKMARFLGFHAKLSLVECYTLTNEASTKYKKIFYNELVSVFKDIPRYDDLCLFGDRNTKIGNDYNFYPEVLGKHGIGMQNDKEKLLINFVFSYDLLRHSADSR
ncbi:hypothetical protein QYM36_014297 [Artemia franciscana]|uniref:Uncharacterized protein n=1 Tax=Artemia franciscana TaxID=6661 RepID=A0AA88HNA3_ARTSF|nr:hypothetical protein QYM36_014297 [Artemia franciscana]